MGKKGPFQPYDPEVAARIYRNNRPHWRQPGATYFVTFRLGDSIPKLVIDTWEQEKRTYLQALHGIWMDGEGVWKQAFERLPKPARDAYFKEFNRQMNGCLDEGKGACALVDPECAACVKVASEAFDGERYDLGDLVVMPNHVHLLMTPYQGHELESLLKGVKGVSARKINKRLNRSGTLWQKDSYDHLVRNEAQLRKFRDYIWENPAKEGLDPSTCLRYRVE